MLKLVPIAAAALMAMSAHAVDKNITVTAEVNATLDLLSADGSALPTTMQMAYQPGGGLNPATVQTKIFTNDKAKDVQIRVANDPKLTGPSGAEVPLTVKLGGTTLTTTQQTLQATSIFLGDVADGSSVLPLSVSQTTRGVLTTGNYQGLVTLVLTQAP